MFVLTLIEQRTTLFLTLFIVGFQKTAWCTVTTVSKANILGFFTIRHFDKFTENSCIQCARNVMHLFTVQNVKDKTVKILQN